jgi:hypothetical protein
MVDRRDVELAMRVKDLASADFAKIKTAVDNLNTSLEAQVAGARQGKVAAGELRESLSKLEQIEKALVSQQALLDRYRDLAKKMTDFSAASKTAKDASDAMAKSLSAGEVSAAAARRQQEQLAKTTERTSASYNQARDAFYKTQAELLKTGIGVKDLDASQKALINTATQVGQAKTVLSASLSGYARNLRLAKEEAKALAAEEKKLAAPGGAAPAPSPTPSRPAAGGASAAAGPSGPRQRPGRGGDTGLFGLRGFELQNLGYQVNDIVTQLASGTGIGQVIGQQGGQILQIFNRNLFDLIGLIPRYAGVIAVATTATLAFFEAARQQESTKQFRADLLATTSGLAYQATQLTAIRDKVRDYGVSWADAGEAIRSAIGSGVAQDRIAGFLKVSQDIVDRVGGKVPEVFKALVEGFGAGYESIVKLNQQYQFLTAAQAENIRGMFESGKQAEANATAFDLLSARQRAAAEEGLGPWGRALREVGGLYRDFMRWLSDTGPISVAVAAWNGLANVVEKVAKALRSAGAANAQAQLKDAQGQLAGLSARQQAEGLPQEMIDQERSALQMRIKQLQDYLNPPAEGAPNGALMTGAESGKIAINDFVRGLEQQKEAVIGLTDERRRELAVISALENAQKMGVTLSDAETAAISNLARETEDAKIKTERYTESQKRLTQAVKDGTNAAAIAAAGVAGEGRAREAGVVTREGLKAAREQAEAQERERLAEAERAKKAAEAKARSGAAADRAEFGRESSLMSQLSALSRAGGARGLVDLEERIREIDERFAGLARNILAFRAAGGTSINGKPIAEFETDAKTARDKAAALETVRFQEEKINTLLSERNTQVQTYTNLAQTGAITLSEAQDKTAAAYAKATPEILKAVAALEELIGSSDTAKYLSANQLDLLIAKAQQFRSEARYISPDLAKIQTGATQAFTSSAVSGIQDVTKAIAEAATQTGKWGNVLQALGNTALNVLASIAQAVAKAIFEIYAARAASALFSGAESGAGFLGTLGKVLGLVGSVAGATSGAFSLSSAASVSNPALSNALLAAPGTPMPAFRLHRGGIVGAGGEPVVGAANWFANAPRYHSGGMVGLRPDEQAAVLQKGEEVLSKDSPRNRMNGGDANQDVNIRNVLLFDEAALAGALATPAGERVVVNIIKRNAASVRQMVRT